MAEYLTDTNILLRSIEPRHPMHAEAAHAITSLLASGEKLVIFPQNLREFWNVSTRPLNRNGLGLTPTRADSEVQRLEAIFTLLGDGLPVYQAWRRIVVSHGVSGVQVHDAYLVAAMQVHGLTNLLTFNVADFTRYADIGIMPVPPSQFVASPP